MLSTHDYVAALKRMRKKRYGTTSSWLSQTEVFKNWLEDAKSSTFLLSGIRKGLPPCFLKYSLIFVVVGSGKSVVTSVNLLILHI